MRIDILTLFPEYFNVFEYSIIHRAMEKGIVDINTHNIRDYSINKHKKVDDYPYGGGAGMVMTPQPLADSIEAVKAVNSGRVIYLGPRGTTMTQKKAIELSKEKEIIFLCGHYEGIDERVRAYIDEEISLGDFVLTGGEAACIPIVDSICRMIPGVLSCEESYSDESFYNGLLEYPQYTRPEEFRGMRVPDVLLSGHHENIKKWRKQMSIDITKKFRYDLYEKYISNLK
ncbi:tRNA (Guanine37-N(1)-) methyltransferase [Hathewaya proteolytica DSM 3090]|uniref:tRNA (guanine-N(1)-)-methyltransferase n=1 Tax=Hathewaya proteolytica DSM 3090 TaxID=1121331 RepID=A0A1M6J7V1_9CLOT|nr:tRNA (guanosine(37)-N1)-methyltransferase TrmD [Hathewaya proteolytica]SHJ42755.1 tRNA (Guanine37-N(1)-) methyltransferase [Hathewaya proteolytica DSM 3090]